MAIRLMFIEVETQRTPQQFSQYTAGSIIEGNWDNLGSAGVSIMVVKDTAFTKPRVYTEETVQEGVNLLRAADLVIGYNLRDWAYIILQEYANYSLQRLPTFDMQAEIQFLRGKRAGVHWQREKDRIPFISLTNLANHTCDKTIYTSGRGAPLIWEQGNVDWVVEYVSERVEAIQAIFNHGCRHGAVSYKQAGNILAEPVILPTPMWKHKARSIVDSVVPKPYIRDEDPYYKPAPDYMFALPTP